MNQGIALPQLSPPRPFTEAEHETWGAIMAVQRPKREQQIHPHFMEGLARLEMDQDRIPSLAAVNKKLKALTGWKGCL
jgi:phenylalanine-4-hydroxylase